MERPGESGLFLPLLFFFPLGAQYLFGTRSSNIERESENFPCVALKRTEDGGRREAGWLGGLDLSWRARSFASCVHVKTFLGGR